MTQKHTGLNPLNGAMGKMYNVQMVNVCREIEQEFAVLSIQNTPKLVHKTFFESPTFVNCH